MSLSKEKCSPWWSFTSNTDPVIYTSAAFGQGTLPILLDDVYCNGYELQLISCAYDSNTADCSHQEDAGVKCSQGMYICIHRKSGVPEEALVQLFLICWSLS